jgi:hypothetical protein
LITECRTLHGYHRGRSADLVGRRLDRETTHHIMTLIISNTHTSRTYNNCNLLIPNPRSLDISTTLDPPICSRNNLGASRAGSRGLRAPSLRTGHRRRLFFAAHYLPLFIIRSPMAGSRPDRAGLPLPRLPTGALPSTGPKATIPRRSRISRRPRSRQGLGDRLARVPAASRSPRHSEDQVVVGPSTSHHLHTHLLAHARAPASSSHLQMSLSSSTSRHPSSPLTVTIMER